jgi:hypothetical protein
MIDNRKEYNAKNHIRFTSILDYVGGFSLEVCKKCGIY